MLGLRALKSFYLTRFKKVNDKVAQMLYSKTCLKRALKKKTKIGFQTLFSHNAGKQYCRMLQGEHSAIPSTFCKLPFLIKIFILSIFEWLLKTGFTVFFL